MPQTNVTMMESRKNDQEVELDETDSYHEVIFRKRDLGSGNPRPQRSAADGETHCDSSCRIDLEGPRVWQTLETRWMARFRVWQTLSWRTREKGNTLA